MQAQARLALLGCALVCSLADAKAATKCAAESWELDEGASPQMLQVKQKAKMTPVNITQAVARALARSHLKLVEALAAGTPGSAQEQAIQGVIDQIWDTYDHDKSGHLCKEETKRFVQQTLGNLGSGDEFSQEAFDEVFATFDKDNSGFVEKSEMVSFIVQLMGNL
mmetsp:Transcript_3541/g.6846  ORF Transcript_3541/g.6846 Transcript_3541/m.6846 type:complete len:166 (+) Transcript_3541:98-595(+)